MFYTTVWFKKKLHNHTKNTKSFKQEKKSKYEIVRIAIEQVLCF